jgi:hypothetical protein
MPLFLPEIFRLDRYYAPMGLIKLVDEDWQKVENILSRLIPTKLRKLIEQATEHLVSYYCLNRRAPKPGELKDRLRDIKSAADRLLKLCVADPVDLLGKQTKKQKLVVRGTAQHVLSVNQIVNQYLFGVLSTEHQSLRKYLTPVDLLGQACDHGLQKIKERSTSGRKVDPGLSYLIAVAIFTACKVFQNCDFKLPSPRTKSFNITNYPLLAFIREIVTLAVDKGIEAIEQSTSLKSEEIRVASKLLRDAKDRTNRRSIIDLARDRLSFERKRYA